MRLCEKGKAILITGAPKSGSTWIGHMVALEPSIGYIHEPFNLSHDLGACRARFDYWFSYVCAENEQQYIADFERTFRFQYNLIERLESTRSAHLKKTLKMYVQFLQHRLLNHRPLMKDPLAIFSAEWLANTFDMDVVVIIRHPAAFVASYKAENWTHAFDHFLKQPLLMRDKLNPYKSEIEDFTAHQYDIVDQATLLWRLIYGTVLNYQQDHPEWIFVRHEDISLEAISEFTQLYGKLNLTMSNHIVDIVRQHSWSKNNAALKRNSVANITTWKSRLTTEEIARTKEKVSDISAAFYAEEEW